MGKDACSYPKWIYITSVHEVSQPPLSGSQLLTGPKLGCELREKGSRAQRQCLDLLGGLMHMHECAHVYLSQHKGQDADPLHWLHP